MVVMITALDKESMTDDGASTWLEEVEATEENIAVELIRRR